MANINPDHLLILAGIMGLDVNSRSDSKFIGYCINGINDIDAFIQYCNDKKDGIIAKRQEKLNILSIKFKKMEEDARLSDDSNKALVYAKRLAEKVAETRSSVKNAREEQEFKGIDVTAGFGSVIDHYTKEKYFTDKEIATLVAVAKNTEKVIFYSETGELADMIYQAYINKLKPKKKYEALADGQKNVMKMISGAVKHGED